MSDTLIFEKGDIIQISNGLLLEVTGSEIKTYRSIKGYSIWTQEEFNAMLEFGVEAKKVGTVKDNPELMVRG